MFDGKWYKDIKKYTKHDNYEPILSPENDLGLIELKKPFEWEYVRPACLPKPLDKEVKNVDLYKGDLVVSVPKNQLSFFKSDSLYFDTLHNGLFQTWSFCSLFFYSILDQTFDLNLFNFAICDRPQV